ncbi:MAG: UDP-3-O-(3-hydroxymyristoyl)glucosamine N-acyltransferase [Planctomycetota bacterium]
MTMEAQELAQRLGGVLEGRSEVLLDNVRPPESAGDGDLAWIADHREIPKGIAASAVLVGPGRPSEELLDVPTIIRHENSQEAFARAILLLHPEPEPPFDGISETARIHPESHIAEDVHIGPAVFIGSEVEIENETVIHPGAVILGPTKIGTGVTIHANVVIYGNTQIGAGSTIHAGTVIGGDGFGYAVSSDGARKIPHRGGVRIGPDVEIGCNCTIDRGALEETILGEGCKLDNLVHIAHNVEVGPHSFFAAQVGIAGSSKVGQGCEFGGQSGMAGHLEVGDKVRVAAQTGILKNFGSDLMLMGFPADDGRHMRKVFSLVSQLPELRDRIRQLEQHIKRNESPDETS